MYLLLLLAIGGFTASPLAFQGTPMSVVNASHCHCLSLVRLRNERAKSTPDCCSHDDLVAFVRATQERSRGPAWFQLCPLTAHDCEVYCLTHLRQRAVTLLALARRVPDKPRQNDALAVNFVAKFLLQHAHASSREALDPSHSILDRTI